MGGPASAHQESTHSPTAKHTTVHPNMQEQALEAFEALESAVLREVQPHSPRPPPRSRTASPAPAKELGAGAGTASRRHASLAGSRAVLPPAGARQAAPASQQWPLDAAACGGASDGEEGVAEAEEMSDVFQSDGEGAVRVFGEGSQAQAAAAGIVHPLAARPLASAAVRPSAAAAGQQRQRQPPVYYDDDEDEGAEAEMQAEVGVLRACPLMAGARSKASTPQSIATHSACCLHTLPAVLVPARRPAPRSLLPGAALLQAGAAAPGPACSSSCTPTAP